MIITIIPAKPFSEAKTRLASVLIPEERAALSRMLLEQTVRTASQVGPVVVVSRSLTVRQVAAQLGAMTLAETDRHLNLAVQQGLNWASEQKAEGYLVIPTDLPYLSATDLLALTAIGLQAKPSVVIAPCQREQGTNALFLNPANIITPQFGLGSFQAHQAAARAADVAARIYRAPNVAFDLDNPDDWHIFIQHSGAQASMEYDLECPMY